MLAGGSGCLAGLAALRDLDATLFAARSTAQQHHRNTTHSLLERIRAS